MCIRDSFNNIQSLKADRLTSLTKSNTYDYSDVLIWTKGRHTFKFGLNIQTLEAITPLGFNCLLYTSRCV